MADEFYFKLHKYTVGYEKKEVLSEVELSIKKGEILTLVGPNGAGKTTILRSIMKQLSPLNGTAYLSGEDIGKISDPDMAKLMAVVLTERLQTEMMTVEEVVETGRYPYTGRFGILGEEDHTIVDEAMAMIHIEDWKDRDFMKLSDGQKQKVMLARALAQKPEIILLDEPTSFLDIKHKMEFLSILQKLSRENGLTVIMSLHEIDMAEKISDKIACFRDGVLDRFGTPEEVFKDQYILKLYDIHPEELSPVFQKLF